MNYLRTFRCLKNKDVQDFLHDSEKSIRMQKESTTRSYLIIDNDTDQIVAYFAIAFKPIILGENHSLSKRKVRKLPVHTDTDNNVRVIPTILIGQIGRSDEYTKDDIDLGEILDYIFGVINVVRTYIGGKVILVEVDNEPKLVEHYEKYGFERIQNNNGMSQLMQFVSTY